MRMDNFVVVVRLVVIMDIWMMVVVLCGFVCGLMLKFLDERRKDYEKKKSEMERGRC